MKKTTSKIFLLIMLGFPWVPLESLAQIDNFMHDTRDAGANDNKIHFTTSNVNLQSCTYYRVVIDGTFNIYSATQNGQNQSVSDRICGTQPATYNPAFATHPSPGLPAANQIQPRWDPEFNIGCGTGGGYHSRIRINITGNSTYGATGSYIFGAPNNFWKPARDFNLRQGLFLTSPNFSYEYIIKGEGHPLAILQASSENGDDFGQLRVRIFEHNPSCDEITVDLFPNIGIKPCNVLLSNSQISCLPAGFKILKSLYDFGDGNRLEGDDISYTYQNAGTYNITGTHWISNGQMCCKINSTAENHVEQPCEPCTDIQSAEFVAVAYLNNTVDFSETSGNLLGMGATYLFAFGDGTTLNSSTPFVSHDYGPFALPSYNVTVTVNYFNKATGECCSKTYDLTVQF